MRTARRHREHGLAQGLHPRPSLSDRRLMTEIVLAPLDRHSFECSFCELKSRTSCCSPRSD
ncbi:uncharacterized, partial [Tachysurus ichikawai]